MKTSTVVIVAGLAVGGFLLYQSMQQAPAKAPAQQKGGGGGGDSNNDILDFLNGLVRLAGSIVDTVNSDDEE